MNGTISGVVFLDDKANGRMDSSDARMPWVTVVLDGEEKTFTNSEGRFYFESVPMGSHTVEITQDSLPKGLAVLGPSMFNVTISEQNLDSPTIEVPIVYKSVN